MVTLSGMVSWELGAWSGPPGSWERVGGSWERVGGGSPTDTSGSPVTGKVGRRGMEKVQVLDLK